jgi:3-carboxy-cis,cis-muconate cycloisomerase
MPVNPADSPIFGTLFGTDAMRAVFDDRAFFQRMLDVEAALARVEAQLGIIPHQAAQAISAAASLERLSLEDLAASTRVVGYPVVGLTKALGRCAGPEAARWVHWGATTQDIVDSARVLQIREGLDLIEAELLATTRALSEKARRHRDDPMAGRTHLQHALPITFGYKCAVWLEPLLNHIDRMRQARRRALRVQFGGAVGTLASLHANRRRDVTLGLAETLGLGAPDAPWHVSRDDLAEICCVLALVCGSLSKIATDVILLMQTEVAEVFEPHEAGRGSSSTMPQKRNPIASEYVLAAARAVHALVPVMLGAMVQDHERATGPWQSEQLALPQIFLLTAGALAQARAIVEGMTVDVERMRRNLDATQGLVAAEAVMMALAEEIGRGVAHDLVHKASDRALAERRPLAEILAEDPAVTRHLDAAALARLTDPAEYLGEARDVVDRVLERACRVVPERKEVSP